jgi:hypothetical protein
MMIRIELSPEVTNKPQPRCHQVQSRPAAAIRRSATEFDPRLTKRTRARRSANGAISPRAFSGSQNDCRAIAKPSHEAKLIWKDVPRRYAVGKLI